MQEKQESNNLEDLQERNKNIFSEFLTDAEEKFYVLLFTNCNTYMVKSKNKLLVRFEFIKNHM